jgi:hypothetical protein
MYCNNVQCQTYLVISTIFQLYRRFDVFSFYNIISIVKIDLQRRVNLAEHFMIILHVLHICI